MWEKKVRSTTMQLNDEGPAKTEGHLYYEQTSWVIQEVQPPVTLICWLTDLKITKEEEHVWGDLGMSICKAIMSNQGQQEGTGYGAGAATDLRNYSFPGSGKHLCLQSRWWEISTFWKPRSKSHDAIGDFRKQRLPCSYNPLGFCGLVLMCEWE